MKIQANYYQQFDADFALDVPAEGYGGWKKTFIEIAPERTAVVVMHAWDFGTREEYPGWHRAVEYIPRAQEIVLSVFPRLLKTVRTSGLRLYHVVGGGDYYCHLPGYQRAVALTELGASTPKRLEPDPVLRELQRFRAENVFVGTHNQIDVAKGFNDLHFPEQAQPLECEGVAENADQLHALCSEDGVNHLIYVGFAINWCLLLSPGGISDMSRMGYMCSTIRQAVTAVENRETARDQLCKELALWRVALAFGFVFDLEDFLGALSKVK